MKEGTVCVGFLDNDTWSACFGLSLRDLLLTDATVNRRIVPNGRELRYLAPSGGIVEGRNTIARQFIDETECEWLWFVDSDMGFGPLTVEHLIKSAEEVDAKVMGALCFGLKKEASSGFYSSVMDMVPTLYDWYEDDDKAGFVARLDYELNAIQPVVATGAACILIHRTVLEWIREKYGDHWFDQITHPKGKTFSEDFSFCIRVAAVNETMYVNTDIKTVHHKGAIYLSEVTFDRQMRAIRYEKALEEATDDD